MGRCTGFTRRKVAYCAAGKQWTVKERVLLKGYNWPVTRAEIALLLAQARARSGLTQTQLASAMGTTQPAVARAESGYRLPSIEFIDRWAKATGRPITLTLGGSRSRVPSRSERRRMVRDVFGAGRFNPWERNPSPVEAALLEKAGLDRTYFEQLRRSGGRSQSGSQPG